jgi:hypothetical protein
LVIGQERPAPRFVIGPVSSFVSGSGTTSSTYCLQTTCALLWSHDCPAPRFVLWRRLVLYFRVMNDPIQSLPSDERPAPKFVFPRPLGLSFRVINDPLIALSLDRLRFVSRSETTCCNLCLREAAWASFRVRNARSKLALGPSGSVLESRKRLPASLVFGTDCFFYRPLHFGVKVRYRHAASFDVGPLLLVYKTPETTHSKFCLRSPWLASRVTETTRSKLSLWTAWLCYIVTKTTRCKHCLRTASLVLGARQQQRLAPRFFFDHFAL